jgi:hypothetical protein
LGRAGKRSWSIGLITHDAKRTGERRTGNPFAPFEEAGGWKRAHVGTAPALDPTSSATLPAEVAMSTSTSDDWRRRDFLTRAALLERLAFWV